MANRTIQIPRVQGTLSVDPSGDQITVTGLTGTSNVTATSATVITNISTIANIIGRMVTMTSGNAIHEHRFITGVSGNTITLSDPWGTHWFKHRNSLRTGMPFSQGVPSSGDSFIISWNETDLAGANGIQNEFIRNASVTGFPNSEEYRFRNGSGNRVTLNPASTVSGVSFHADSTAIIYDSRYHLVPSWNANRKGYVVLGKFRTGDPSDAASGGYPTNPVHLVDVASNAQSSEAKGAFHQYGGEVISTGNGFLRYNAADITEDGAQDFVQFLTKVDGRFASRVSGDRSILNPLIVSGNESRGYCNPVRVGYIGDATIADCRTAIYNYFLFAGSTTVEGINAVDINTALIYFFTDGGNKSTGETLTLRNWDLGQVERLVNLPGVSLVGGNSQGPSSSTVGEDPNNLALSKQINFGITNEMASAGINIDAGLFYEDITGVAGSQSIDQSTGLFPVVTLPARTYELPSAFQSTSVPGKSDDFVHINNFDDGSPDVRTPYTYGIISRNREFVSGVTGLTGPIGPIAITRSLVPDPEITETNTATVDAYTELETTEKLYDYAHGFKSLNQFQPEVEDLYIYKSGRVASTRSNRNIVFVETAPLGQTGPLAYTAGALTIVDGSNGFDGGVDVGIGNVTFNSSVKGSVVAGTILHNFVPNQTIIETSESVSGIINLNAGTYDVTGGSDISLLEIFNSSSETDQAQEVLIRVFGSSDAAVQAANALSGNNVRVETFVGLENRTLRVEDPTIRASVRFKRTDAGAGTVDAEGTLVNNFDANGIINPTAFLDVIPNSNNLQTFEYDVYYLPAPVITADVDEAIIYDYTRISWAPATAEGNTIIRSFRPDPSRVVTSNITQAFLNGALATAQPLADIGGVQVAPYLITGPTSDLGKTSFSSEDSVGIALRVLQSPLYLSAIIANDLTEEQRILTFGDQNTTEYNGGDDVTGVIRFESTSGQRVLAAAAGFRSTQFTCTVPGQADVMVNSVLEGNVINLNASFPQLEQAIDSAGLASQTSVNGVQTTATAISETLTGDPNDADDGGIEATVNEIDSNQTSTGARFTTLETNNQELASGIEDASRFIPTTITITTTS